MAMEIRQTEKTQMHRRKSSKGEDENVVIISSDSDSERLHADRSNGINGLNGINRSDESNVGISLAPPPRNRVSSTPGRPQNHSSHSLATPPSPLPSPGPFRTSFARAPNGTTGHPASPFRATFSVPSHSRTRSISTPFSPALSSPLSASFPSYPQPPRSPAPHSPTLSPERYAFPTSSSGPELSVNTNGHHTRRHSRVHSRNLSVFFPRPGSLPQTSIAEDGTQELEISDDKTPVSAIPDADARASVGASGQLGAGFTFGARPPGASTAAVGPSGPTRRGHHHKHSLSHNFFSFLEPGSQLADLHTQPTPVPTSPWTPISSFPQSATPSTTSFSNDGALDEKEHHTHTHSHSHTHTHSTHSHNLTDDHSLKTTAHHYHRDPPSQISPIGLATSVAQFLLGSWLWVTGQQIGSLSCTGLGYWVVFDAFGVATSRVVPGYLSASEDSAETRSRRPYGNARVQTVLMFAQSVYLMFSSVYVCKETVEHLLLSAGEGQGHHHHRGDEDGLLASIDFPVFLTFVTLLSLLGTAFGFDNHSYLVNITDNRLPSFPSIVRSFLSPRSRSYLTIPYDGRLARVFSNPFVASPVFFCVVILIMGALVPASQHRTCDLLLAAIQTVVTFNVAYRACVILGAVLLQTSPPRGLSGGRMEAFLRVMRELERHPQVLHLPAPHIWQLTPTHTLSSSSPTASKIQALVVTLELHVREDLGDDDVLKLTKWAWEKCVKALGGGLGRDAGEETEVTVGVVRG